MSNFLKSNKIKLALGAVIVGVLCMLCAIAVAPNLAKAEDEAGARTVNFYVYDTAGGTIDTNSIEIDATVEQDTYSIWSPEGDSNDITKLYMFDCGTVQEPINVTFYETGHCDNIMFMAEDGETFFDPGDDISFSSLEYDHPGVNNLYIVFYGEAVEAGWVHANPEDKINYFDLNVVHPWLGSMPLWQLAYQLGLPYWEDFKNPSYLFQVMPSSSVVAGRSYKIDNDGTVHVKIGVLSTDVDLTAKAVGKEGAIFDHWTLNGTALKNGTEGVIPDPYPIEEGLNGYELVANFFTDAETATVTFDPKGGTEVLPQTVVKGQSITKPEDPSKGEGFMFDGWFVSPDYTGGLYDFTQPVNSSFTLYAKWVELPKVVGGEGQVWYFGSLEDISFTSTAKYENFVGVTVDGDEVDSSAYTVEAKDGNTVVSLKSEYLTLMTDAEHHIGIVSKVETATQGVLQYVTYASFTTTVEPIIPPFDPSDPLTPPQTGDFVLLVGLMFAALGVLGFGAMKLRRNRSNS